MKELTKTNTAVVERSRKYKLTEVGVIPEDWLDINLGGSSILKARIGWQGLTTAEYLKSGDYYLITGTDFLNGFIDWDNCVYVEKERYVQDKNIQIVPEDILVTKDGTIGKVAFIDKVTLPTTLNSGVFVIRPKRGDYHPRYLYHILMSEHFKDFLGKLTAGSTISHLYQKDFVHYEFPAPPTLTEQKAIATALSDVDELIANLDKLIVKKKAIKQGAMQQLLMPPSKGGKRLAGFSGEWEEKTLGECLKYEQPTKYIVENSDYEGQSQTPVLTAGKSFLLGYTDEDFGVFNNYPVIIFDDFTTSNQFVNFSFKVKSSAMKMLQPVSEEIDIKFMFSIMNQIRFFLGDDHKRRWIAEFSKIEVFIPQIKEQKAIAQILSDMDEEIEALEAKKEKYKGIKQGMMQELLTGKIRLV